MNAIPRDRKSVPKNIVSEATRFFDENVLKQIQSRGFLGAAEAGLRKAGESFMNPASTTAQPTDQTGEQVEQED